MAQPLNHENRQSYGVAAILIAAVLWGTTGTAASFAPSVNSMAIGAFSMGLGGMLLALFGARKIKHDWRLLIQEYRIVCIGAIALAIYPLAFYSAMRLTGVAIGTVISIASAPFFVALIERLFSKENNINRRWIISLVIGAFGMLMLTTSETNLPHIQEDYHYLGIVLGLLAGLTYALYSWAAKRLINRGLYSQSAMGGIFGLGGLLLLPIVIFNGDHLFATLSNTLVVMYIAFIPMFIGYVFFGYGLKTIHASKATLLTLFEPVVAAIFAVYVVGESISHYGWIGIFLIMLCLFLQSKPALN